MALLANTKIAHRVQLTRLLRLSLATWLVALFPALIWEYPVLRMSFDLAQSLAIIGQAGLVMAATLTTFAIAIYAAASVLLRASRLGNRLKASWVVGTALGFIAIAASFRTAQLWLGEFWKGDRPIPPAVEFSIWLACLTAMLFVLRFRKARQVFDDLTQSAAQLAVVALIPMFLFWAYWTPNYLLSDHQPTAEHTAAKAGQPNIVLITIDTLSARNTSLLGYERETTPNLERFSERSTVFADAISSANFTTPGVAAIMTGRYATRNGTHHLSSRLPVADLQDSVPGKLREAGYQLAAFVGNNWAHPANLGLDPYFDVLPLTEMRRPFAWPYLVPTIDSKLNGMGLWHFLFYPWTVRLGYLPWWNGDSPFRAEEVIESAKHFLQSGTDGRPLFLWLHIFPPHGPYLPPGPHKGKFLPSGEMQTFSAQETIPYGRYSPEANPYIEQLRDRYDENISYVDSQLGEFLDFLRDADFLSTSYVIITSDHGESFEKGWRGHDVPALHQALIHVPLVVYSPRSKHGALLDTPVQTVDVAATIMDVAGVRDIPRMDGRSLKASVEGVQKSGDTIRYAMWLVDTPDSECPDSGLFAVLDGKRKLVWDKTLARTALYDLAVDEDELVDVSTAERSYVAQLKRQVEQDLLECGKFRDNP